MSKYIRPWLEVRLRTYVVSSLSIICSFTFDQPAEYRSHGCGFKVGVNFDITRGRTSSILVPRQTCVLPRIIQLAIFDLQSGDIITEERPISEEQNIKLL
jgi:hypothetical protein